MHWNGVAQRLDQHHQMTVLGLHLIHKCWCVCTSVTDGRDQPALRRWILQEINEANTLSLRQYRFRELIEDRLRLP